jgi:hypothetical protein
VGLRTHTFQSLMSVVLINEDIIWKPRGLELRLETKEVELGVRHTLLGFTWLLLISWRRERERAHL